MPALVLIIQHKLCYSVMFEEVEFI